MYEKAKLGKELKVEDKGLNAQDERRVVISLLKQNTPQFARAYKSGIVALTGLALATGVSAQSWLYGCPKVENPVALTGREFHGISKDTLEDPVIQEWVTGGFKDKEHAVTKEWIGSKYVQNECIGKEVFDAYKLVRGRRDARHDLNKKIILYTIILDNYINGITRKDKNPIVLVPPPTTSSPAPRAYGCWARGPRSLPPCPRGPGDRVRPRTRWNNNITRWRIRK